MIDTCKEDKQPEAVVSQAAEGVVEVLRLDGDPLVARADASVHYQCVPNHCFGRIPCAMPPDEIVDFVGTPAAYSVRLIIEEGVCLAP